MPDSNTIVWRRFVSASVIIANVAQTCVGGGVLFVSRQSVREPPTQEKKAPAHHSEFSPAEAAFKQFEVCMLLFMNDDFLLPMVIGREKDRSEER